MVVADHAVVKRRDGEQAVMSGEVCLWLDVKGDLVGWERSLRMLKGVSWSRMGCPLGLVGWSMSQSGWRALRSPQIKVLS